MTDSEPTDPVARTGADPDGAAAQHLVAIVFDRVGRATEVLVNLTNLQAEGALVLADAVLIAKSSGGRPLVQQTVDVTPAKGAAVGTWLGLLGSLVAGPLAIAGGAVAGALYGKLVDQGLDDGWAKEMSQWLAPATSGLLLLVTIEHTDRVLSELGRYEGRIVSTDLTEPVRRELEAALRRPDDPVG